MTVKGGKSIRKQAAARRAVEAKGKNAFGRRRRREVIREKKETDRNRKKMLAKDQNCGIKHRLVVARWGNERY